MPTLHWTLCLLVRFFSRYLSLYIFTLGLRLLTISQLCLFFFFAFMYFTENFCNILFVMLKGVKVYTYTHIQGSWNTMWTGPTLLSYCPLPIHGTFGNMSMHIKYMLVCFPKKSKLFQLFLHFLFLTIKTCISLHNHVAEKITWSVASNKSTFETHLYIFWLIFEQFT